MSLALLEFADVPVMPVTRVDGHVALGGPVWPAFEQQSAPRHCRGEGEPVDRCPPLQPGPLPRFRRAAVWGGSLDTQFGHLVAEHLMRLPPSIRQRPHDIVLLALPNLRRIIEQTAALDELPAPSAPLQAGTALH